MQSWHYHFPTPCLDTGQSHVVVLLGQLTLVDHDYFKCPQSTLLIYSLLQPQKKHFCSKMASTIYLRVWGLTPHLSYRHNWAEAVPQTYKPIFHNSDSQGWVKCNTCKMYTWICQIMMCIKCVSPPVGEILSQYGWYMLVLTVLVYLLIQYLSKKRSSQSPPPQTEQGQHQCLPISYLLIYLVQICIMSRSIVSTMWS